MNVLLLLFICGLFKDPVSSTDCIADSE
jgi:hypothetical protein